MFDLFFLLVGDIGCGQRLAVCRFGFLIGLFGLLACSLFLPELGVEVIQFPVLVLKLPLGGGFCLRGGLLLFFCVVERLLRVGKLLLVVRRFGLALLGSGVALGLVGLACRLALVEIGLLRVELLFLAFELGRLRVAILFGGIACPLIGFKLVVFSLLPVALLLALQRVGLFLLFFFPVVFSDLGALGLLLRLFLVLLLLGEAVRFLFFFGGLCGFFPFLLRLLTRGKLPLFDCLTHGFLLLFERGLLFECLSLRVLQGLLGRLQLCARVAERLALFLERSLRVLDCLVLVRTVLFEVVELFLELGFFRLQRFDRGGKLVLCRLGLGESLFAFCFGCRCLLEQGRGAALEVFQRVGADKGAALRRSGVARAGVVIGHRQGDAGHLAIGQRGRLHDQGGLLGDELAVVLGDDGAAGEGENAFACEEIPCAGEGGAADKEECGQQKLRPERHRIDVVETDIALDAQREGLGDRLAEHVDIVVESALLHIVEFELPRERLDALARQVVNALDAQHKVVADDRVKARIIDQIV